MFYLIFYGPFAAELTHNILDDGRGRKRGDGGRPAHVLAPAVQMQATISREEDFFLNEKHFYGRSLTTILSHVRYVHLFVILSVKNL